MDKIDAEWLDICHAVYSGPASWQDWIDLGVPEEQERHLHDMQPMRTSDHQRPALRQ
jgi:hypothetical protein